MWTRQTDVSGDRVRVHREQATGGPGSATLADVVEDRDDLVRWESSIFEWCALSFGEGLLAGSAVDHANPLTAARPAAKIQVPATACTVIGARVIPATEVFDRVHSGFFRRSNFRPGRYLRSVSHTRPRLPTTVCSPKTPPARGSNGEPELIGGLRLNRARRRWYTPPRRTV